MADLTVSSIAAIKAELISREAFLGAIIEIDQEAPVTGQDQFDVDASAALARRRAQNLFAMAALRYESP